MGISVVIPCYNSEKTIVRCLESIRRCEYSDLEIIVIDDCSTDGTAEIIREYGRKTKLPIKLLINDVNQGPGRARNRGMTLASKEYLTFIDSDDEIKPDFFRLLNQMLTEHDSDCVIFDALSETRGHFYRMSMFFGGNFSTGEVDPKAALAFVRGCPCGKIYRTELILNNGVQFPDLWRGEDFVFTKIAMSWCRHVFYLQEPLYIIRENMASLTHNDALLDAGTRGYEIIKTALENRGFEEELQALYMHGVVYASTMTMIRQGVNAKTCRAHYRQLISEYTPNNRYIAAFSPRHQLSFWLLEKGWIGVLKMMMWLYKKGIRNYSTGIVNAKNGITI